MRLFTGLLCFFVCFFFPDVFFLGGGAVRQVSARASQRFAASISKIVVEISPPGKITPSSADLQITVNEGLRTITCVLKLDSVVGGKIKEGWGPRVDKALGLCALTDGYIDKVKLSIAAINAEVVSIVKGVEGDVDWSFIEDANYKKLEEGARQQACNSVGALLKAGLLDRTDGLARHLARSERALGIFLSNVKSVELWVSADNKCKAPFEISEQDGKLRVGVRLNALGNVAGWGPAVDDKFGLQVVDEEGMRQVLIAVQSVQSQLPAGLALDFDYSVLLTHDKWKKMKPDEKKAFFTSLCKKTIPLGINDKREGLLAVLERSSRVRSAFCSRVGTLRIRIEVSGKPVPMLQDPGILVLPLLLADVDGAQAWGTLADACLGTRIDDELAIRKAEAAIEKSAMGKVKVTVDWASFADEPALVRSVKDKRLAAIQAGVDVVQTGISQRQGLIQGAGTALTDHVDHIVVRVAPTVAGKGQFAMRYGADRVLEVTVKANTLTSAGDKATSWLDQFKSTNADSGTCSLPAPYSLLVDGDSNAQCQVAAVAPLENALLSGGAGPSTVAAVAAGVSIGGSSSSSAPAPAAAPVAAAPRSALDLVQPPPVSPGPIKANAAPMASACTAPNVYGSHQAWDKCVSEVKMLAAVGFTGSLEVDWGFLDCATFTSQADPQKKVMVTNLHARIFAPLNKDLTKVGKSHPLYVNAIKGLSKIRFHWDENDKVLDMSSGKLGKTHYYVRVEDGVLDIACNLKDHMTGIIPALEGKLQVAFNLHHLVVVEQLTGDVSRRGQASKIECFLDPAFITHEAFMTKPPITMDALAWWAQVAKECLAALDKLLKSMEVCRKDPIFDEAVRTRYSSILVQPDPTNSVRDQGSPSSWIMIGDAEKYQLVFKYNLNDGTNAGQSAGIKWAAFVNVKVAQAIAAARKDAGDQLVRFNSSLAGVEMVLLNFFEEPSFTALPDDKAIAGCAALKPWLAGVIRQLGLVVARNAAVFKEKAQKIEFGLDPANSIRGADESTLSLENGVLRVIQNMTSAAKPDATIAQRVDNVFDVTMANVATELAADMKQRSVSLSTSLKIPDLAVNIDFSFEKHPPFEGLLPQAKQQKVKRMRNHLESILDSLVHLGPDACIGLVAVMLQCDLTDQVSDPMNGATDADHYSVVLTADGLMRVTVNYAEVDKQLGRSPHKVTQQMALHRARQDKIHDGVEFMLWDTLQCPGLLNDSIPAHFELSLTHCKDCVRGFNAAIQMSRSGSPAGAAALAKISQFYVRMDPAQRLPWQMLLLDNEKSLCLSLNLPFVKDRQSREIVDWKEALEWTLWHATVEVEKFHAENRKKEAEKRLQKAFGRPCPVTIDWATYIDTPAFIDAGAAGCRDWIRHLSIQFLEALVDEPRGILSIGGHPVGSKELKARLKTIYISNGPAADLEQRLKQPVKAVFETTGNLRVTFRDVYDAARVHYASRISFEMGILVQIAEHDASDRRAAVSKALGGIPITYTPEFTQTDEFKYLIPIATQPKIVDIVVAGIVEHWCARAADSLLSIWPVACNSVKGIRINVVTNHSLVKEHGKLSFGNDGVLELTYDLAVVTQYQSSVNWRSRAAHVLRILDTIGQKEANAKLALTEKELKHLPVKIDWSSFVNSSEWIHLPAADRYERMHNLGGEVTRNVLLGYWGLPGLLSFAEVLSDVQSRVKLVEIAVNPAANAPKTYITELKGTTLRITLCLTELLTFNIKNVTGCRERVEKLMGLRPLLEKCAQQEVERQQVAPVASALGVKVTLVWSSIMKDDDYLRVRDYVAYIRYIGTTISPLLLGSEPQPEGLPAMQERNREAKEFFAAQVKAIEIKIDGSCTIKPPQERFVHPGMHCTIVEPLMTLTVRRDWMEIPSKFLGEEVPNRLQSHNGCAAVVEWVLTPALKEAAEEEHVETFRNQLIYNEEQRRNRIVQNWSDDCARAIEDYNDYMQEYAEAGRRNCSNCKGSGYDSFFRRQCSSCDGTGKCQSRMRAPQMPINPPKPNFPDMGVTDWRAIALGDTRARVHDKIPIHLDDHPAPSQPRFEEQPCPRYSATAVDSYGAEDPRPDGLPPIKANLLYVPGMEVPDNDEVGPRSTKKGGKGGKGADPERPGSGGVAGACSICGVVDGHLARCENRKKK